LRLLLLGTLAPAPIGDHSGLQLDQLSALTIHVHVETAPIIHRELRRLRSTVTVHGDGSTTLSKNLITAAYLRTKEPMTLLRPLEGRIE
jgi:hypothetical protein